MGWTVGLEPSRVGRSVHVWDVPGLPGTLGWDGQWVPGTLGWDGQWDWSHLELDARDMSGMSLGFPGLLDGMDSGSLGLWDGMDSGIGAI